MKTGPRLPVGPSDEQATVKAILQFLHLHKIVAWRMNVGGMSGQHKEKRWFMRFGATGMADIIGVLPVLHMAELDVSGLRAKNLWGTNPFGQFLAVEVKSAAGKVRPAQQMFLDEVTKAGGKAFVARNLDDVKRELGL